MNRLVVKSHNPLRVALLVAAIAAGLLLAGWAVFLYGGYKAGYDCRSAKDKVVELGHQKQELDALVAQLREQKAVLERSRDVERQAAEELNGTVAGLQGEISELKSELAFYRGIVSPKETAGGLRIQRFELAPNGVARGYRYKLVLTQVLKNGSVARGYASMRVEGTRDGELATLSLADLGLGGKDGTLYFRFRYFQDFEGNFVLPEGFVPSRVTVEVDPRSRGHRDFEKVFEWSAEET